MALSRAEEASSSWQPALFHGCQRLLELFDPMIVIVFTSVADKQVVTAPGNITHKVAPQKEPLEWLGGVCKNNTTILL